MDSFLASIPFWVYAVVLVITFVLMHAMFFVQRMEVKNRGLLFVGRIGSSFILLAGLLVIQPDMPVTILAALALAVLAGYVSGRSAPPIKPREAPPTAAEEVAEVLDAEGASSVTESKLVTDTRSEEENSAG